jgi:hypothetical protein
MSFRNSSHNFFLVSFLLLDVFYYRVMLTLQRDLLAAWSLIIDMARCCGDDQKTKSRLLQHVRDLMDEHVTGYSGPFEGRHAGCRYCTSRLL